MTTGRVRIAVGLGCDRGTSERTLQHALDQALDLAGAALSDVAAVASIDLKADEPGLLALATTQGWSTIFYTPAELSAVPVPNPSETVRKYTGTPSVSEAAALLAAARITGRMPPMTALLLEKYKYRDEDGRNATVSLASCDSGPLSAFSSPSYSPLTLPLLISISDPLSTSLT